MVKRHLLRISTPRTWPIKRKKLFFVTRPNCGSHKLENCMSLGTILTEILQQAKTNREAKLILRDRNVLVNKKVETDPKVQVGFMDTLELPKLNVQYRMIFNKQGNLFLKETSSQESGLKVCKITSKKSTKGNKTQLGLDDGSNILTSKDEYKLGDSLVLTLPERKIKSVLKLEKGATVYMLGGKNMASIGTVESIKEGTGTQKGMITVKSEGEKFETRKDYAFVVGKDKPMVSLE